MNLGLEEKRVFITASSGGIGLATAEAFLREGANIIINGRREDRLCLESARFKRLYGTDVDYICGDMTNANDIRAAADMIRTRYGSLDVFVANLGSGKPESDNPLEKSEWQRFYDINVKGAVEQVDCLYELLSAGNGPCITFVSSVIAREVSSAPVGYAAAKSSIRIISKYLSRMWANDGIRVNCVLPGNVYFKGGRWEQIRNGDPESTDRYISSIIPMKRFGRPEEIADAILFLSSERAGFITGAEIVADGGQSVAL